MENLAITLVVAVLGSSVLSTLISKLADYIQYKRKRKDDKEDNSESITQKLDLFQKDFNKTNDSLTKSLQGINADLNRIHESMDAHGESIDSLKQLSETYRDRFYRFEEGQKEVNHLQNAALTQILGQSLKERAYKFLEDGEIPYLEYEVWIHDFEVYTNLGGNSVVAELRKEITPLPKVHK